MQAGGIARYTHCQKQHVFRLNFVNVGKNRILTQSGCKDQITGSKAMKKKLIEPWLMNCGLPAKDSCVRCSIFINLLNFCSRTWSDGPFALKLEKKTSGFGQNSKEVKADNQNNLPAATAAAIYNDLMVVNSQNRQCFDSNVNTRTTTTSASKDFAARYDFDVAAQRSENRTPLHGFTKCQLQIIKRPSKSLTTELWNFKPT